MRWIVPLTLVVIVILIRINTRGWVRTGIVMLAVPFSLVGALWTLYLLGYHFSTAVWVGMIALMGVDAQTGVFMLLYLDLAYENARRTRESPHPGRSEARDSGRCGDADPPEGHDRHDHDDRATADLLVDRARVGPDEAYRRPDGRRDYVVLSYGTAGLSGALFHLEAASDPGRSGLLRAFGRFSQLLRQPVPCERPATGNGPGRAT